MDYSSKYNNLNPKLSANILSKLTFSWLIPLFWYGRNQDLEEKDIHDVLPENESDHVGEMLGRSWREEVKKTEKTQYKPSLFKAVARTFFWPTICYGFVFSIGHVLLSLLLPMTIENYIKYFDTKATIWNGIGSASLVVLIFFAMSFALIHSEFKLQELGMRAKIACSCLIYRKMVRLSYAAMTQIDEGHIINLLSNDVIKWEQFFMYVHFGWIAPVQLLVVVYIMLGNVQTASIIGISAFMLQTLPVQGVFNRIIYNLRLKTAVVTDRRILLITEVINGIKLIKMYNWEKPFKKFVLSSRKREMKLLKLLAYTKGIFMSTSLVISKNSLFVTILVYFLTEGRLMSSENMFGIWRYFTILETIITFFLPYTVTSISETRVAVKRIERFLLLEEMKNFIQYYPKDDDDNNSSVSIQGVSVSWGTESTTNILSDISITMFYKKLYVVGGPAGAGKSSLLKLILGELQPKTGTVSIHGKVSYSSQEPWLFSGSIKNNILFGEPYDEARYRDVTNACALNEDFNQLPYGDKTFVGDGGSMLSGGQRARINLARAIYRRADIYLLDDCLSAVDVSVGKVLYEKCYKDFLKEKTCILVTHNLSYLNNEDEIILMNKGTIKYQGTFANLEKTDRYSQYFSAHINHIKEIEIFHKLKTVATKKGSDENLTINCEEKEDEEQSETEELIIQACEPRQTEDAMVKGKIATILYWKYLKSGGSYWILFVTAFTTLLSQAFLSLTDLCISYISQINITSSILINETKAISTNFFSDNSNDEIHIAFYIFGFLVILCIITIFVRTLMFFSVCINASKNIHNKMFIRLLRAPLSFFHMNNIGRIINRFSQDTGSVDNQLAALLLQAIQSIVFFIALLLQICVVQWWIFFPAVLVIISFIKMQNIYQATARDIRRLEGVAKSPVFSHVNSSFAGLLTIRSCRSEELVYEECINLQNHHTSAYYFVLAGMAVSNLWTEILKNVFIAFISYSFLFTNNRSTTVDFIYIQISFMLDVIRYIMKMFTEILVQMVNLERMFQFTEVKQEGTSERHPEKKTSNSWPSHGYIQIDNLYLKYLNTTKPVLKNLNFSIAAGQRIGIVGRTGAGKSSLIAALFRLVDFDGCIYIDNANIKELSLEDIRSRISIIPQESLLFTVTLRENLDPNSECSDETILSALQDVGLGHMYNSLSVLLDKKQLSVGQIQLLSLARTIIRKNKILVLDEATANVDNETDVTVQNIIKNKFKDCTIISVAHRFSTIIDSDKVLVMDNGQVLEFDHPYVLLQKEDGFFKSMVLRNNDAAYEELKQIAKVDWIMKQKCT